MSTEGSEFILCVFNLKIHERANRAFYTKISCSTNKIFFTSKRHYMNSPKVENEIYDEVQQPGRFLDENDQPLSLRSRPLIYRITSEKRSQRDSVNLSKIIFHDKTRKYQTYELLIISSEIFVK